MDYSSQLQIGPFPLPRDEARLTFASRALTYPYVTEIGTDQSRFGVNLTNRIRLTNYPASLSIARARAQP